MSFLHYTWDSGAGAAGGFAKLPPEDTLEGSESWSFEPSSGIMTWETYSEYMDCVTQGNESWPVDEFAYLDQLVLFNMVSGTQFKRSLEFIILGRPDQGDRIELHLQARR